MSRSVSAPSSVTNTSPCWKGLIVPGSTFRYGSHFCRVTLKPRLSRRQPIEEAATPFPSEETTPPVTKIYFGAILIARIVRRACLPSTGLTYIELWPQPGNLSNRSVRSAKTVFLICQAGRSFFWSRKWNFSTGVCLREEASNSGELDTFPYFQSNRIEEEAV